MSQSNVLRIMEFHLLAVIVNRPTPISKQKMFLRLRRQPQGIGSRVSGDLKRGIGYRGSGLGKE